MTRTAYKPFLLPLIKGTPHGISASSAASPLEEEAIYNNFTSGEHPEWASLAESVQEAYGLPLLLELCDSAEVTIPAAAHTLSSPNRFLHVCSSNSRTFVLEHPDGLECYDRYGQPDQVVGIARPSLFARLLSAASGAGPGELTSLPDRRASGDTSMEAFHRYLGRIVGKGSPSDWHLEAFRDGFRSRLRIDGQLTATEKLRPDTGAWIIHSMLSKAGIDARRKGDSADGSFRFPDLAGRECPVRFSLVPGLHGDSLVARFLYPGHLPGLEGLGLATRQIDLLRALYRERDGLWLVAGPTGSGKSTTLHALLKLSTGSREKVLAVEDPVEETLSGVQHVQVGTARGLSYARTLRAFMRQSPDCLLVGEIRDKETAAIALQAARTGHRVLSSVHARDTRGVLRRFADLDQPPRQVASNCRIILHQRLLPLLCRQCRQQGQADATLSRVIALLELPVPDRWFVPVGCPMCCGGYKGRTGIFHIDNPGAEAVHASPLQAPAWELFRTGETGLASVLPYLPPEIRGNFTVCQV